MTLELIVPPKVELQIAEIDLWWRTHREKSPELFAEELSAAFQTISTTPRVGRRCRSSSHPSTRRLLLRATRFHVYYVEDVEVIVILSVWSAVRGFGPDLDSR